MEPLRQSPPRGRCDPHGYRWVVICEIDRDILSPRPLPSSATKCASDRAVQSRELSLACLLLVNRRVEGGGEGLVGCPLQGAVLEEVGVGLARAAQLADQGPEALLLQADEPVELDDDLRELLQGAPLGLVRVALLRGHLRAEGGVTRGGKGGAKGKP